MFNLLASILKAANERFESDRRREEQSKARLDTLLVKAPLNSMFVVSKNTKFPPYCISTVEKLKAELERGPLRVRSSGSNLVFPSATSSSRLEQIVVAYRPYQLVPRPTGPKPAEMLAYIDRFSVSKKALAEILDLCLGSGQWGKTEKFNELKQLRNQTPAELGNFILIRDQNGADVGYRWPVKVLSVPLASLSSSPPGALITPTAAVSLSSTP